MMIVLLKPFRNERLFYLYICEKQIIMNVLKKYFWQIAVIVLLFILFFKGCGYNPCSENDKKVITIPEKKGEFKDVVNPKPETIREPFNVVKWKDKIVYSKNPVNDSLVEVYKKVLYERDSLKALAMYSDAVAIREYNIKQEDSLLITENYIKAQGEVKEFKQSYTIKERKESVKMPVTRFRLLAGLEAGNTLELDNFNVKGSVMFQNTKGNALSLGYDIDRRIWIGYYVSIFEIKK